MARIFAGLSKIRLGGLVVLTTISGFLMAPVPFTFGSLPILALASIGTCFCVSSANTLNQVFEVKKDMVMRRTLNRPIAAGHITRQAAFIIAITSGVLGTSILYIINPLTAALGFSNIIIYSCIYTPLKQIHTSNTWVGAIVGAIPPLMGCSAAVNSLTASSWILFYLLYFWQLPHFYSLSWLIKDDYSRAEFEMLVCKDPTLTAKVAYLTCLPLFLVAPLSYALDIAPFDFLIDSTVVTAWFLYVLNKFKQNPCKETARKAFITSIFYLPIILLLMFAYKQDYSLKEKEKVENSVVEKNEKKKN